MHCMLLKKVIKWTGEKTYKNYLAFFIYSDHKTMIKITLWGLTAKLIKAFKKPLLNLSLYFKTSW